MCIKPENELLQHAAEEKVMEAVGLQELKRLAIAEKIVKKRSFALYKKHITGRGYAWPVGCTMPDDAQAAVAEGMREGYALGVAQFDSVRQQLEEANVLNLSNGLKNCILKGDIEILNDELTALRSSRDADIERAIRLTLAEVSRRMLDPAGNKDRLEPIADAVLAQLKEHK